MNLKETEQLLVRVAAIDSRVTSDLMVAAWQEVLANVTYPRAVAGLVEHRRRRPGVYCEPGHVLEQVKIAMHKHREIHGIHPAPPLGKRWAVDIMDDPKYGEVEQ